MAGILERKPRTSFASKINTYRMSDNVEDWRPKPVKAKPVFTPTIVNATGGLRAGDVQYPLVRDDAPEWGPPVGKFGRWVDEE